MDEARAREPERVAESAVAPAVHVDAVGVQVELALPSEDDRGEGLVDFEAVDVTDGSALRSSSRWVAGIGPVSMMTGSTPTVV